MGLLKAVGARSGQILAVFLAEAILVATLGGLLGLGLGWLGIRMLVLLYPAFPAATPLWAVRPRIATSVVVGALFGVLPARRATRLDPVAALAGKLGPWTRRRLPAAWAWAPCAATVCARFSRCSASRSASPR